MRNINWDNVQEAQDYVRPTPGGYIVRIVSVEDEEQKEYLRIRYDFVEGDLRDYYKDLCKRAGFWGGEFIRSYKERALPFFKAFKTAVEESNPGYVFQNDPQTLVRKYLGIVLGEEEYYSRAGEKKKRLYVAQVRSGQAIREGDYEVPELKKVSEADIPNTYSDAFTELADDDDDGELPF